MSEAKKFQSAHAMSGRFQQLTPEQFVSLIDGVCLAVEQAEVPFHGNLNAANISLNEAGEVGVGEALAEDHGRYTADQIEYIAPEVFWNDETSEQADVYSIGMLMYTWANAGCLPFLYPDATANDRAEALRRRMSGESFELSPVSDTLNNIINKATAFKKENRYESVADLREAFQFFAEEAAEHSEEMKEKLEALKLQKQQEANMLANILAAAEAAASTVDPNAPKTKTKKQPKKTEPTKKEEENQKMSLRPLVAVLLIAAILMIAAVAMQFGADGTTLSNNPSASPSSTPVVPTADVTPSPEITPFIDGSPLPSTTDNPFLTPTPSPSPTTIVTIDTSRYNVVKSDVAWSVAAENCMAAGGNLATINNQDEFNGLTALADKYGLEMVWIGGFRKSGDIVWLSGETTDYLPWAKGEPSYRDTNNAQENFLLLVKTDGTWGYNDVVDDPVSAYPGSYSGKIGYIMEK